MESRIKGYAFIESIAPPNLNNSRLRQNIVFDFIEEAQFKAAKGRIDDSAGLFIVRVMSTVNRLNTRFPEADIVNGSWLKVVFQEAEGEPRVWLLSADDDFNQKPIALNLVQMVRVSDDELRNLRELCTPKLAIQEAAELALLPSQQGTNYHVRVIDVGQANCSAIHTHRDKDSPIVGYFDVGGPVFFHKRTFPKSFDEATRIRDDSFVVLSHWDFDHYSLALTRMKSLQTLNWFAPDQNVGPVAARLQSKLGRKLTFLRHATHTLTPGLELWKGSGNTVDRNKCGYAMTVNGRSGRSLLTGDMPYDDIPVGAKAGLSALAVTHHGGAGSGTPPKPSHIACVAAVSFGLPNRYHHPDPINIQTHRNVGWLVTPTCESPTQRGDVWL